ncbi:MAG TPA: VOC family protein [Tepidisphaeraceae bacterium]|nr:VOC family protein [Tepidisphaeraceae bacterium]
MLRRIDRILIRVSSLGGAVKFYHEVLGLTVLRQDARMATLQLADEAAELVLHVDPDLPEEAVYFLVDHLREMYARRDELRLQFVTPPTQVSRGFTAVVKDPFGTVMHLIDRQNKSAVEDATPIGGLFAGVETRATPKRELLVKLYEKVGRTADDLPYTPQFEQIYEPYIAARPDPKPSRSEVWRHLLNLRKSKKLPKLGDARSKPPDLPPEMREQLRELLGEDIGKRDRLPYTERFDELVDGFNKALPRPISPHLIWRAVATLAK